MATEWLERKRKELAKAEEKENDQATETPISWNPDPGGDFDGFEQEIRQAAQHRNGEDISDALRVYLWGYVDQQIRDACDKVGIVPEGRSCHFLSHSAGTWFRLPRSLNVTPDSFGKAFFQENIYAKFYDNYFREIPKELLVTLGDFFVQRPGAAHGTVQLEAFDSPTLVVIADKDVLSHCATPIDDLRKYDLATVDGKATLQVVALEEQTISSVGKEVFTKDKDSFQALIRSCHRFLSDRVAFLADVEAEKKSPICKALYSAMENFTDQKMFEKLQITERGDQLEITLAFLLSFYSALTTDFERVYAAYQTHKKYDYKSRLLGLYVDPIKASFTNRKKRGAFFVGFSCEEQDFLTRAKVVISDVHDLFSRETKRLYGLDSQIALETADGQSRILLEEMLVRCSLISDKHKEDLSVNTARRAVLNALLPSGTPLPFRTEGRDAIRITDVDPVKTITGASECYRSLLERLIETAKSNLQTDATPGKFKGGQCIFLYSPPGCGKETIASSSILSLAPLFVWPM